MITIQLPTGDALLKQLATRLGFRGAGFVWAVVRLVERAMHDAFDEASRGPDRDQTTIPFRIGLRSPRRLQPKPRAT